MLREPSMGVRRRLTAARVDSVPARAGRGGGPGADPQGVGELRALAETSTYTYDVANRDLASLIDEAVTPFTDLVDWQQKDDLQRPAEPDARPRPFAETPRASAG